MTAEQGFRASYLKLDRASKHVEELRAEDAQKALAELHRQHVEDTDRRRKG